MAEIRRALEREILQWPGVFSKEMMGCLCYFYGRRFFAFLVTGGIVITKLSKPERTKLTEVMHGEPFEMAGKPTRLWKTPLKETKVIKTLLPYVRKSYETATES